MDQQTLRGDDLNQSAAAGGTSAWRVEPRIGKMLARTWELFKLDAGKYVALTFILIVPYIVLQDIWGLVLSIVPLLEGMMVYALIRASGGVPKMRDIGLIFVRFFPLLLMRITGGLLIGLGYLLLIIPGIYLSLAYLIAMPVLLDRSVGFWEALETSRKIVTKRWGTTLLFVWVVGLICGALALTIIGILASIPLGMVATVALYESALGVTGGAVRRESGLQQGASHSEGTGV